MNRDTLYSCAVIDISKGATLTIPETGDRYLSVMVVNEDHYINKVYHDTDQVSYKNTHSALLELSRGIAGGSRMFGKKEEVGDVRHLLGTAFGWGGLPEHEASYLTVEPNLPVGAYQITVKDVPVDAFWSISLYNRDGYFQENEHNAYSVNNITGKPNKDGSFTVHFGGDPKALNYLPIMEGWNYAVRLYQPRKEILDGTWTFPAVQTVK